MNSVRSARKLSVFDWSGAFNYGSIRLFVGEKGGGRCRSVEKSKSGLFHLAWKSRKGGGDFHFSHRRCDDYGE
jgi:hypothetical protein